MSDTKTSCPVPFAIEADHPRNDDLMLQSIPNCRLRSRIKASRTVTDAKSGIVRIPVDQGRHLGQIPEIPGMVLEVDPEALTYTVVDPLYSDKELCKNIRDGLAVGGTGIGAKTLRGVKPQPGTLDVHRMKTLCYEVRALVSGDEACYVDGPRLTEKGVNAMPGHKLQNPGSRVHNGQPRFEKDMPEYLEKLQTAGA